MCPESTTGVHSQYAEEHAQMLRTKGHLNCEQVANRMTLTGSLGRHCHTAATKTSHYTEPSNLFKFGTLWGGQSRAQS